MKKKTLSRIAVFAFALCMVSTALLSNTLAAFYTEIEGTGSIVVADFTNLSFKNGETDTDLTATFNLADTKAANTKVMEGTIAPGDTGSFKIVLGASEVAYKYSLEINAITAVEGKTVPVVFYTSAEMNNTFEGIGDAVVALAGNNTTTSEQEVTVYWKWLTTGENDTDFDIDYKNLETSFKVDLSASQDITTTP